MQYHLIASILTGLSLVNASPSAQALPWAKANPQANAAAQAYAEAYAEAEAIGHADPEAYALAASADDCATIACHASCGLLISEGQKCSENTANTYEAPYDTSCLCNSDSPFQQYVAPCLDCGWTLWKYYGGYVESALAACNLPTEPTGTLRCSTTLSDEYTLDYSVQGCSYLGNCDEETSTQASSSTPAVETTSEAQETSTVAAAEAFSDVSTSAIASATVAAVEDSSDSTSATASTTVAAVEDSSDDSTSATASATATTAAASGGSGNATSANSTVSTTATATSFEGAANKVTSFAAAVAAVGLSFLI